MKSLSIIIPMYDVAPYVERCIRSLEDQDIPKDAYELICVNDGSPDNCRLIVEKLQIEFSNIVLINQENQGVSIARNNGMDRAIGKYLLMIDPDDYVDSNCFARVLKTADKQNAQVSFLGFTFRNEDGTVRKTVFNKEEKGKIYPGTEAYYVARGDRQTDPDRMWAVLFERNFMSQHQLRYLPNVPYLEDGEFIARILCLAKRCIFDGQSFLQRTTRPGSATNSKLFRSEKATSGFIIAAINITQFQSSVNLSSAQKDFLNQAIVKFATLPFTGFARTMNIMLAIKVHKSLRNNGIRKLETNGCDNVYSKIGKAYNKGIVYFVCYWNFRRIILWIKYKFTCGNVFLFHLFYKRLKLYDKFIIRN